MKDHRLIDERSLAFDRVIVGKLRSNRDLIGKAQSNLIRWLKTCSPSARPSLLEWQSLLDGPDDALFTLLEGTDERAARLRQSSPFCGILTQEERTKILRDFQAREPLPA